MELSVCNIEETKKVNVTRKKKRNLEEVKSMRVRKPLISSSHVVTLRVNMNNVNLLLGSFCSTKVTLTKKEKKCAGI